MSSPKPITITQVLSHYNVIGMAISIAVGIASKDLVFSLSNDIILPLIGMVVRTPFFDDYEFDGDKFLAKLLTFGIVLGIILFLLYVVLRPMVRDDINGNCQKKTELEEIDAKRKRRNGFIWVIVGCRSPAKKIEKLNMD